MHPASLVRIAGAPIGQAEQEHVRRDLDLVVPGTLHCGRFEPGLLLRTNDMLQVPLVVWLYPAHTGRRPALYRGGMRVRAG
jgi:hypothetical protein